MDATPRPALLCDKACIKYPALGPVQLFCFTFFFSLPSCQASPKPSDPSLPRGDLPSPHVTPRDMGGSWDETSPCYV